MVAGGVAANQAIGAALARLSGDEGFSGVLSLSYYLSYCPIAVYVSDCLSQCKAQARCDAGSQLHQLWQPDLLLTSGRRPYCCLIAFHLTSSMSCPTWSVSTHHSRKLIMAVEGHRNS